MAFLHLFCSIMDIRWVLIWLLWCLVVLHFVEYALMFLCLPETKGRTIEELEDVFKQPNPVKASLKRKEVVMREGEGVKMVDE